MTRLFPFRAPSRFQWECPSCSAINDIESDNCWQCEPAARVLPCGCTLDGQMCEEHRP